MARIHEIVCRFEPTNSCRELKFKGLLKSKLLPKKQIPYTSCFILKDFENKILQEGNVEDWDVNQFTCQWSELPLKINLQSYERTSRRGPYE